MRRRLSGAVVAASFVAALAAGCGGGGGGTHGAGHGAEGGRPVALARVGSVTITSSTLDERVKDLPAFAQAEFKGEEGRKRLLDRLIEEEVMYQAALDAGLADDPDVARKVRDMRRRTLVEAYYTRNIQDAAKPDSATIASYYREHADEFTEPVQVRARHILVKSEADARRILADVRAGRAAFETAARTQSTDVNTKEQAGLLPGFIAEGRPVGPLGVLPEFVKAAVALQPGQVSEPVKTAAGWHLIKIEERKEARVRPLEEVRDQIEARGSGERIRAKFTEEIEALKKKYRVTISEPALHEAPAAASAEEIFQEAQQTTDPRARIALYQRVLDEFPRDKRNYEAQFMIGFVYSEDLKDFPRAKEAFDKVIANYPQCDLVESAKWMIANMHLDNPPFLEEGGAPAGAAPRGAGAAPGHGGAGHPAGG